MSNDSLKKRYFYKLLTNLAGFLFNLISAAIVPRTLGVSAYGNFNFTTTIITQFLNLIEFRSSACFFTKISQRPHEKKLVLFYGYVSILFFVVLSCSIIIISVSPLRELVFQDQDQRIILFALPFVMLTWSVELLVKVMDAYGATVPLERMRMINRLLSVILLILLYFSDLLSLDAFFYYQYVVLGMLSIVLFLYVKKRGYFVYNDQLSKPEISTYFKEFYAYTAPLGFYIVLQFGQTIFDRWILQYYGGSFQQGLYSFSFSLSNFCFLFITAMIPLFTRELSVAAGENNISEMARLFRQYVPMLYAITAYFCCFIFVESEQLVRLFGGGKYGYANLALKILAFYPLVSVYSNLNGAVIYANGRTGIFFRIAIFFTPISIAMVYVLISNGNWGLNLGAEGLAIKNLLLELLAVIIILRLNAKFLNIRFWKFIMHMIFSICPFLVFAFAAHYCIGYAFVFVSSSFPAMSFFISGFLYSATIAITLFYFPIILGLKKEDMIVVREKLRGLLSKLQ